MHVFALQQCKLFNRKKKKKTNLDTDNLDEISDGLVCITLFFQKRMKHLQIVVNGLIPRDAINTKRRQKLLEVNQLLQDKCMNYTSVCFLKPIQTGQP